MPESKTAAYASDLSKIAAQGKSAATETASHSLLSEYKTLCTRSECSQLIPSSRRVNNI